MRNKQDNDITLYSIEELKCMQNRQHTRQYNPFSNSEIEKEIIRRKITDVLFLIEKPEGELTCNVFAFMPKELHNNSNPKLFTSYAHIEQHSACCLEYANECKEATSIEYSDLKKELESIGYNLNILNK